ncbi:ABC transporter substrate-binding protein [Streptomyces sp. NBC_01089]|uniref:ABC transporter substrate-binding protein n=1 Tax=Streptomyces sp. NBC_01089 TaxID=2903747 RepID=UPI00386A08CC|nr:ABC transporter substrate-binding protein [Streptomyces sp. NBC_01089]
MTVTIGVHPANPTLFHLARLDYAQQELAPLGETVDWHHYTDGVSTGALLTDGTLDFGGTGSTPPITAQAEGHDIVYTAVSAPRPGHGALLVLDDGPVRGVADLRTTTVHLAIGSWQTHLVAKALHDAGLDYGGDITPRRGTSASEQLLRDGEIAAWVAQGAELVAARERGGLRVLIPTADVITDRSVFFARRDTAERRPELIAAITRALHRADAWVAAHSGEAAGQIAGTAGGSAAHWQQALSVLPWRTEAPGHAFVDEQQQAADILYAAGFLPAQVTVADALARPVGTAQKG